MSNPSDFEIFQNKKTNRTYVSPEFENKDFETDEINKIRRVSRVIDSEEFYDYLKRKDHVVLRETKNQRQEVIATVNQETKEFSITIQRFEKETGTSHKRSSFCFRPHELENFFNFIENIDVIDLERTKDSFKVENSSLSELKRLKKYLSQNENIVPLLESLPEKVLPDMEAAVRQTIHRKAISDLEKLLYLEEEGNIVQEVKNIDNLKKYASGKPELIFNKWLKDNKWSLGVEYIDVHEDNRIAFYSEADLLMETTDGFLDLIELKRPKFDLFKYDTSHDCYVPKDDLSQVLGQSLFYLQKLDEYKHILENENSYKVLKPRVKIIIGRSNNFEESQTEALRMLNSNLNHIQVVTYDHVVEWGNKIIEFYQQKDK